MHTYASAAVRRERTFVNVGPIQYWYWTVADNWTIGTWLIPIPQRIRRSERDHDVSEEQGLPIGHASEIALSRTFVLGAAR